MTRKKNLVTLSREELEQGLKLLELPRTRTRRGIRTMVDPRIMRETVDGVERIASANLARAERSIAEHLQRLARGVDRVLSVPADAFGSVVPDESQAAAVQTAAESGVICLTGGPGVGKTLTTRAVLAVFDAAKLKVACCAPTGKAVIRMTEQTGQPASTVHRLIEMIPGQPAKRDAARQLECGAVIVDEVSMVDVELMAALLEAIPSGARLLLVGDVDQLPSVGPGRVFFDIIESGVLEIARLTKIHRQAAASCTVHEDVASCPGESCSGYKPGSRIPYVARDINEGRCPDLTVPKTDFVHWETEADADIAARILNIVSSIIPERRGIPASDVQVLAAQYDDNDAESPVGIVGLNRALQARLNPSENSEGDVFVGRNYSVRLGDRVIHTKNNYDLAVMNGEIGRVVAADLRGLPYDASIVVPIGERVIDDHGHPTWKTARVLIVDYVDRRVAYSKVQAKELELAYCVSVHRAQGSGFPAVVLAVPRRHSFSLHRALVYTAVTRAEKLCATVGPGQMIARAAQNTRGTERRTQLLDHLVETTSPKKNRETDLTDSTPWSNFETI